ncbi:GNAT family N-acetyltransferase [Streptomyces sp. NPDC056210]|uniref:GNAT family N-acetyltransferase n=1 Tax=Streptomyces sp. NPDC056210 TaxID=3345746 RepID=UPI0035D93B64
MATIDTVAVHPDHQHQGHGRALLAEAQARARVLGLVTLDAWTRDLPETLRWYRAVGFIESDHYLHVYANYYTESGEPDGAIGSRRPYKRGDEGQEEYEADRPLPQPALSLLSAQQRNSHVCAPQVIGCNSCLVSAGTAPSSATPDRLHVLPSRGAPARRTDRVPRCSSLAVWLSSRGSVRGAEYAALAPLGEVVRSAGPGGAGPAPGRSRWRSLGGWGPCPTWERRGPGAAGHDPAADVRCS